MLTVFRGQIRPGVDRIWPDIGQCRPRSTWHRPSHLARSPQLWPDIDRTWPSMGQHRARTRPDMARNPCHLAGTWSIAPKLTQLNQPWPLWVALRPIWAKLGRSPTKVRRFGAKVWPMLVSSGQHFAKCGARRPNCDPKRLLFANLAPSLSSRGNCSTTFGQLFGNSWTTLELAGIVGGNSWERVSSNDSVGFGNVVSVASG